MKKYSLLNLGLLLLSCCIYGQSGKNNGQLNLSIGPSFPVGQFANKNIRNDKAGIASVGGVINISYQSLLKKNIGFSVSLMAQINPTDRHSMERSFSQLGFPSVFVWTGPAIPTNPTPPPATTYPNWSFKRSSWKLGSLLVGGYSEFKTGRSKIVFTPKAMAGLVYAGSPKIDGESITDTSYVHATQTSESAFGFGYLVEAGLKFRLTHKISFIASVDYFGTNRITFKDIVARVTIIKHPNDQATMSVSQMQVAANGKQVINSINFLAGIALKL